MIFVNTRKLKILITKKSSKEPRKKKADRVKYPLITFVSSCISNICPTRNGYWLLSVRITKCLILSPVLTIWSWSVASPAWFFSSGWLSGWSSVYSTRWNNSQQLPAWLLTVISMNLYPWSGIKTRFRNYGNHLSICKKGSLNRSRILGSARSKKRR